MKERFLVLNCNEYQLEQLRLQLGDDSQLVVCESLETVRQELERDAAQIAMVNSRSSEPAGDVPRRTNGQSEGNESGPLATLAERVDLIERKIILDSLHRNHNHRKDTAAELGISRVTLYNKMKKFGLLR